MSNLPTSLSRKVKEYNTLTDAAKKSLLNNLYVKRQMSFPQIAELVGTYPNKIRRDAKKLGIPIRSTAQAQAVALKSGRHSHPTEGKQHSQASKLKISNKMATTWAELTDEEREYRSQIGREHWESLSDEEKSRLRAQAGEAIRQAAKEGSKLEKFLYDTLTNHGFVVEFHRERIVTNQRLQIDLFLPELNTAIEVDGPSHFRPIWGHETLERNRRSDNQKSGLILGQGWCLIRVRQTQSLSLAYKRKTGQAVLETLSSIKRKFPSTGKRLIIIGGDE